MDETGLGLSDIEDLALGLPPTSLREAKDHLFPEASGELPQYQTVRKRK